MQDSDMAVLLGNLLENTITAAERAAKEHRYIDLNILSSGKMLAITVDNGFDGSTSIVDGQYCSLKEHPPGVGISSAMRIAEQYGGGVELCHDEYIFHSSVMLNIM